MLPIIALLSFKIKGTSIESEEYDEPQSEGSSEEYDYGSSYYDSSEEARSDGSGYGRWGYKPYYHRTGGEPKAPRGQGVRQGKRTGGKRKVLLLVN